MLRTAYRPIGHAVDLFKTRDQFLVCVGPARCGKSRACLEKLLLIAMKYPGARILFTRKVRATMSESILETFENHVVPEHCLWVSNQTRTIRSKYVLPNGSEIVILGLDQASKVLSSEYDIIYVAEAIETDLEDFEILTSRLSGRNTPYRQIILDTNPSSPAHWIKVKIDSGDLKLIQFGFNDNPVIDQNVINTLSKLTGHRRARLFEGVWSAAEGLVFPGMLEAFIDHVDPPDGEPFGAIDFGWRDPTVVLCAVVYKDEAGRSVFYVYDERYQTQAPISTHAAWMKTKNPDTIWFADGENPESIRELQKYDLAVCNADKSILAGIESVNALLDGNRLFISKNCKKVLEEAAAYIYDKSGEKPKKGLANHAMDSIRYLCHTAKNKCNAA